MPTFDLDRADVRILEIVQQEGRIANVDLAERVQLSPSPCLRRLNRLEEAGVITQYAALLEPKLVGIGVLAHLEVTLDKRDQELANAFCDAVLHWPEVLSCYALSGEADYLLKVATPDLDTYSKFLMEKVSMQRTVINTKSSFILQTVKETTALPLDHLHSALRDDGNR